MSNFDQFFNAGGRLLGGDSPDVAPKPKTSHETVLRNTNITISAIIDENLVVLGYQVALTDHGENHTYIFRFADEVRAMMEKIFEEMPHIGEKAPVDE